MEFELRENIVDSNPIGVDFTQQENLLKLLEKNESKYWSDLHVAVQIVIVLSSIAVCSVALLLLYVCAYAHYTNRKEWKQNTAAVEQEEAMFEARRRILLANKMNLASTIPTINETVEPTVTFAYVNADPWKEYKEFDAQKRESSSSQ